MYVHVDETRADIAPGGVDGGGRVALQRLRRRACAERANLRALNRDVAVFDDLSRRDDAAVLD
ncbi:MAG: hypothetical protein M5R40_25435 [Anaerolineae bacterium]|nr:hypothetical protein [Anaerolineae bacterium]